MNNTTLQELKEIRRRIDLCNVNDTSEVLNILKCLVSVVDDIVYMIR